MRRGQEQKITAVAPRMIIAPGCDNDPPIRDFCLNRSAPVEANTSWGMTFEYDPGDVKLSEIHDFIQRALSDNKFAYLVQVAAAHIVASNGLSDPWFRMDRYKTRIDEQVSAIWELAQEIYEMNDHLASPYYGARWPSRRAVGLEFAKRKWSSGDRSRVEP